MCWLQIRSCVDYLNLRRSYLALCRPSRSDLWRSCSGFFLHRRRSGDVRRFTYDNDSVVREISSCGDDDLVVSNWGWWWLEEIKLLLWNWIDVCDYFHAWDDAGVLQLDTKRRQSRASLCQKACDVLIFFHRSLFFLFWILQFGSLISLYVCLKCDYIVPLFSRNWVTGG